MKTQREIGILGGGQMGKGIAACLLKYGYPVVVVDIDKQVREHFSRNVVNDLSTFEGHEVNLGSFPKLRVCDDISEFKDCPIVIENVSEDLKLKTNIISELQDNISQSAIVASNTSSIPISIMQKLVRRPEQLIGSHWGDPPLVNDFLEIIQGEQTKKTAIKKFGDFAKSLDKSPVFVKKDVNGFVANRIGYAVLREAFWMVDKGYISPEEIDLAFRNSIGSWSPVMGPFRVMDYCGVDKFESVMKSLLPDLCNTSTIPVSLQKIIEKKKRGMQTKKGFYKYINGDVQQWRDTYIDFQKDIHKVKARYIQKSGELLKHGQKGSDIVSIKATPVVVPAHENSIQSDEMRDDAKIMKKHHVGSRFQDFVLQTKWIIEMETRDGTLGIGETYRSVKRGELSTVLKKWLGKDVKSVSWKNLGISNSRIYAAVESAILDILGKQNEVPVYQLLGGKFRDKVEVSAWSGRRFADEAAELCRNAKRKGFGLVKFKSSDQDDIKGILGKIKKVNSKGTRVLYDANGRWKNFNQVKKKLKGIPRDIVWGLEDPIARDDYVGMKRIREELKLPVYLHVALSYRDSGQCEEDLVNAIRADAVDGFNINGSMASFVELTSIAHRFGLPCWHGSEVDLGILEASALHACAASPVELSPCDLFGRRIRVHDLLVKELGESNEMKIPTKPGLGIGLDRQALEQYRSGEIIELSE